MVQGLKYPRARSTCEEVLPPTGAARGEVGDVRAVRSAAEHEAEAHRDERALRACRCEMSRVCWDEERADEARPVSHRRLHQPNRLARGRELVRLFRLVPMQRQAASAQLKALDTRAIELAATHVGQAGLCQREAWQGSCSLARWLTLPRERVGAAEVLEHVHSGAEHIALSAGRRCAHTQPCVGRAYEGGMASRGRNVWAQDRTQDVRSPATSEPAQRHSQPHDPETLSDANSWPGGSPCSSEHCGDSGGSEIEAELSPLLPQLPSMISLFVVAISSTGNIEIPWCESKKRKFSSTVKLCVLTHRVVQSDSERRAGTPVRAAARSASSILPQRDRERKKIAIGAKLESCVAR